MKARYTCVPWFIGEIKKNFTLVKAWVKGKKLEKFGNFLLEDQKLCNICSVYSLKKQKEIK